MLNWQVAGRQAADRRTQSVRPSVNWQVERRQTAGRRIHTVDLEWNWQIAGSQAAGRWTHNSRPGVKLASSRKGRKQLYGES